MAGGEQAVSTFTDTRDGKVYRIVKIGGKTWFAENLNFAAEGSRCYGEGGKVETTQNLKTLSNTEVQANCDKYGRLYNWETALKVCPAGFHLPTRDEWKTLADYAGGDSTAGKKLKSVDGWDKNGNGTNEYGFSALPSGVGFRDDSFANDGYYGYWWSATEFDAYYAIIKYMSYKVEYVNWSFYVKTLLFSVRCVADKEGEQ